MQNTWSGFIIDLLREHALLLDLFIYYHFLSESGMVSDLCVCACVPWHKNDLFVSLFPSQVNFCDPVTVHLLDLHFDVWNFVM